MPLFADKIDAGIALSPEPVTVSEIRKSTDYEIDTSGPPTDNIHIMWAEARLAHHLQCKCSHTEEEINEIISGLPRKKENSGASGETVGYGIHAVEGWSVFKFLVVLSMSTLLGLVFFGFWLLEHPGDLQNASIPFFMLIAVIGAFVAIPDCRL
jgi:hypothetical protein